MAERVNPKKLDKRLRWLWDNRTHEVGMANDGSLARWRYIPRGFGEGGHGWGVFDRLSERYLTDAEVVAMPIEQLQGATHLN